MKYRSPSARVMSIALLLALSVLIFLPLFAIFRKVFAGDDGLTFDVIRELLEIPGLGEAFVNTVVITLASALLSTVIGLVLAVAATMIPAGRVMRRLLAFIPLVPLTIPALVGALGWVFLLAPTSGWLNIGLRALVGSDAASGPISVYSRLGVVLVTSLYVVPFVFTIMDSSLRRVNSETLEAMLICGSRSTSMLARTVTGVLKPALMASVTLALVQASSLFSVALILQVDVLPTFIYTQATAIGRSDLAAAAAIPLIVMALALSAGQLWLLRRSDRFATVTGKGSAGKEVSLGRFLNGLFKGVGLVYLVLTGILPLGAIFVVSLLPFWKPRFAASDLSFDNYRSLMSNIQVQNGLRNSLTIGIVCAIGAVAITLLVVVFAERLRDPFGRAAFGVANLPLGIPYVVLGLGFLIAFIEPPIVLYGTLSLLIVAYLVAFLPLSIRNIGPVVQQIGPELEEAALVSGARWGTAVGRITLPLAAPGIAASLVLLFIIIFREFPIASFVATPGTKVVSLALLDAYTNGVLPGAAAIAIVISVVSAVGITTSVLLGGRVRLRRSRRAGVVAPTPAAAAEVVRTV
ncbi:MAG: ABC transporter permease subunit [Acidimicrobiia bacterium]|nr:ABC transporter permease subunit [Acidimicrobiia bacterium]